MPGTNTDTSSNPKSTHDDPITSIATVESLLAQINQDYQSDTPGRNGRELAKAKEKALNCINQKIEPITSEDEALSYLSQLKEILDIAKEIEKYQHDFLIIDEALLNLFAARDRLADTLQEYFEYFPEHSEDDTFPEIPASMDERVQAFHEAEKIWLTKSHFSLIAAFFIELDRFSYFSLFKQLKKISKEILLSDNVLYAFRDRATVRNEAVHCSIYELNVLLFNAWLLPIESWSELFTKELFFMVNSMDAYQEANKHTTEQLRNQLLLLKNLKFLIHIRQSDRFSDEEKKAIYEQVKFNADTPERDRSQLSCFESLLNNSISDNESLNTKILSSVLESLSQLVCPGKHFYHFIDNNRWTEKQRRQIFKAVSGKLNNLIPDGGDLFRLLKNKRLTLEEKKEILQALKDHLGNLIDKFNTLSGLLTQCSLSDDHYTLILTALQDKLGHLITSPDNLRILIKNPNLTDDHRTIILSALAGKLNDLLREKYELVYCLNNKQLTAAHRRFIWDTVKKDVPSFIKESYETYHLLACKRIGDDIRAEIWEMYKDKLPSFTDHLFQLIHFLRRPGLNQEYCAKIITALGDKLCDLIKRPLDIEMLLNIPSLTEQLRTQIISAIKDGLSSMFRRSLYTWGGQGLASILSVKALTTEQRDTLIAALEDNLRNNFGAYYGPFKFEELLEVLNCPELTVEQRQNILAFYQEKLSTGLESTLDLSRLLECQYLTGAQRTGIWQTVKGSLYNVIESTHCLTTLLDCQQITDEHYPDIWEVIKGKLPDLITNAYDLQKILSYERFSKLYFSEIWQAVKHRLDDLIDSPHGLKILFKCKRLSEVNRLQIWQAVKDKLPDLIRNAEGLSDLVSCPQFSKTQRNKVFYSVKDKLGTFIESSYDLHRLLNCPELTPKQRSLVLLAVKDSLADFIKDGDDLTWLLSCPQLTKGQCKQIFTAAQDKLSDLIDSFRTLISILNCPGLSSKQIAHIFRLVNNKLPKWIKSVDNLVELLSCQQINRAQRTQVFTAFQDKPGDFIFSFKELMTLLECSQLSAEQRTQVLRSVESKLFGMMKQRVRVGCFFTWDDSLSVLWRCKLLTDAQRKLVLRAIGNNLDELTDDQRVIRKIQAFMRKKDGVQKKRIPGKNSAVEDRKTCDDRSLHFFNAGNRLPKPVVISEKANPLEPEPKLNEPVKNVYELIELLKYGRHNDKARTNLLTTFFEQEDCCIESRNDLICLLACERLNNKQRELILLKKGDLIGDIHNLHRALRIKEIDNKHRCHIFEAVEKCALAPASSIDFKTRIAFKIAHDGIDYKNNESLTRIAFKIAHDGIDYKNNASFFITEDLKKDLPFFVAAIYLFKLQYGLKLMPKQNDLCLDIKEIVLDCFKKLDVSISELGDACDTQHPLGAMFATHRGFAAFGKTRCLREIDALRREYNDETLAKLG